MMAATNRWPCSASETEWCSNGACLAEGCVKQPKAKHYQPKITPLGEVDGEKRVRVEPIPREAAPEAAVPPKWKWLEDRFIEAFTVWAHTPDPDAKFFVQFKSCMPDHLKVYFDPKQNMSRAAPSPAEIDRAEETLLWFYEFLKDDNSRQQRDKTMLVTQVVLYKITQGARIDWGWVKIRTGWYGVLPETLARRYRRALAEIGEKIK